MGRMLWGTAIIASLGVLAACQTLIPGGPGAGGNPSATAAATAGAEASTTAANTAPAANAAASAAPPHQLPEDPPPPPDTPEQTQAKETMVGRWAGAVGKTGGGIKIVFVDATSKTLLAKKQIDFSPEVVLDLPVDAAKGDLETALADPSVDYIVVLDTSLAKAERRVFSMEKQKSNTVVAVEKVPNPDYDILRMELADNQARARGGGGGGQNLGAAIGSLIGTIMAGAQAEEAKKKLRETPAFIDKPVMGEYSYQVAKVGVTKKMTVNYYVVERAKGVYFKSLFDVIDNRQFLVPYGLSDKDEDRVGILSRHTTDEQVGEWEERPVRVKLSQIAEHYLDNRATAKKLPAVAKLRDELLVDRSASLASYKRNNFGYSRDGDPRMKSVVVVYLAAGLGSGFFVEPDIVLTNWHVVENAKIVELKMFGGMENFGKVIAKDVRLDLALIKVQNRGIPVKFATQRRIELGTTVEAIGHPQKLEFSVTRGIVSSIRDMPPHTGVGGKPVTYVQTDAAINPGNSGGPLFMDDLVIGVNSFGKHSSVTVGGVRGSTSASTGLEFGVHYSEVLNFLRENNVDYLTAESSPRRSAGKGAKQ